MNWRALLGLATLAAVCVPTLAWAHGFDERYDLPAPLGYFVFGACTTVLLSFAVMVWFGRAAHERNKQTATIALKPGLGLTVVGWLVRLSAFAMFILVVVAALLGTGDPLVNLAPTMVWIVGWIGVALLSAFVGSVWPLLDPWRTLYDILDFFARKLGCVNGLNFNWHYPSKLGIWPAAFFLLLWGWLEMVYPVATVPRQLGMVLCVWTCISMVGMMGFGPTVWQRHADMFSVYFSMLGKFSPLAWQESSQKILVRTPAVELLGEGIAPRRASAGEVGFVMAMLSTVMFDGMHGGSSWFYLDKWLHSTFPRWMDINGYVPGTIGLLGTWLFFLLAYGLSCYVTARMTHTRERGAVSETTRRFALTLIPIAAAYLLAHNFSSLLIQGQNAIAMLSDPLGRQWNLFGTAGHYPNIGLIDARTTWYVAIGAIVLGHVLSVWLAHRIALRDYLNQKQALLATLPLTVLMVLYTAISLSVIAEPMVSG